MPHLGTSEWADPPTPAQAGVRPERNGVLPIEEHKFESTRGFSSETTEARGSGTIILSAERKQLPIRSPVYNKSILQE